MTYALPDSVQDTAGNARSGVTVVYKKKGTSTTVASFTTDSNGAYDWATVPDGIYDVDFSGGGLSSTITREITVLKNNVATQTVAAGDTISNAATTVILTGSGGAVTMTSTPTITAGQVGQRLTIRGAADGSPVTLQSQNNLPDSGLKLKNGQNITLGAGDGVTLDWDNTLLLYVEHTRSDNFS